MTIKPGYDEEMIKSLNKDIEMFPEVYPIEDGMNLKLEGVSRLVMLDRYTYKDTKKSTFKPGDVVIATILEDDKYPTLGIGRIIDIKGTNIEIKLDDEYQSVVNPEDLVEGNIIRNIDLVSKPLEIYYEQIAKRNANHLASVEKDKSKWSKEFYEQLSNINFIPAGRVLYGAGSGSEVTYFNCYVMPFVEDSRGGIAKHREKAMEIMSRGGGVGTNGSTLRPRRALARGVNGFSSGSVSWLNDIARLTNLVEQGGSRRGAQMIMMADWHPDIIEFIISKMQNPDILRYIIKNFDDEVIVKEAKRKLKFTPLNDLDRKMYKELKGSKDDSIKKNAETILSDGGIYSVNDPEFLTGANISVAITKDLMKAIENGDNYNLRFPNVDDYTEEQMADYDNLWNDIGDVRKWEEMGYPIKVSHSLPAKELWDLINVCATYSAEPGIFFIDNANEMTNAKSYGQQVVATNPCGEQPLAPWSVCNLAAVNLSEIVDKKYKTIDFEKLIKTVQTGVRMQDNVIDATPYFLEENKAQALGERRIGLGVMGLHDMLIYCEKRYGSKEGNWLVDKVFEVIATTAYRTSIDIAKEKGSFPFLIGENEEETKKLRREFVSSGYMKKMPMDIREGILKHGIRNSHLLTVAPTGSTGTMVNVSTGLEPYFSFSYFRSGRLGKFIEVKADIVQEYLDNNPEADPNNLPDWFVSTMELTPDEHVDVQTTIQRWVDSSISKTVNAPKGFAVKDVQRVYENLYKKGAKGGTVYVDGSRTEQVLSLESDGNNEEKEDIKNKGKDFSSVVSSTESETRNEAPNSKKHSNEKVTKKESKILKLDKRQPKIVNAKSLSKVDSKSKRNIVKTGMNVNEKMKTEVKLKVGTDVGQLCPMCQNGEIKEIGGCNTCETCGMMHACGL